MRYSLAAPLEWLALNLDPHWWSRLRFQAIHRYGAFCYGRKFASVRRVSEPGGVFFEKRRYRRTALLVAVANPILESTGASVVALPEAEWLHWECRIARHVHQGRPEVRGRTLRLPRLPGIRLADYLADTPDTAVRLETFMTVARELVRLHALDVQFPDGQTRHFSHGDAHAKNVLFDAGSGIATWFDFEAMHIPTLAVEDRHADDWRALVFSASHYFAMWELPILALGVWKVMPDEIQAAFRALVLEMQRRPTGFHLAQAPLEFERHQRMCEVLLCEQRQLRAEVLNTLHFRMHGLV